MYDERPLHSRQKSSGMGPCREIQHAERVAKVLIWYIDDLALVELYSKGAIQKLTWDSWEKFCRWLDTLDEDGVQISLKLPFLVYGAVKNQNPSMQNFIVEAVKAALKNHKSSKEEE